VSETRKRSIRVFISSTFADMEEERKVLIGNIFPALRAEAHRRQVGFFEVDLRWGITPEQAERGETLAICMDEIDRCHPYFIGILGERYGWVPDDGDGRSITEREIEHGVLKNPAMARRAYFYFRAEDRSLKVPGGGPESAEAQAKQKALKERIESAGFPVRKYFRSPKELGELVDRDLRRALDEEFPPSKTGDEQDQELWEQETFLLNRTRLYSAGQPDLERLDAYVLGGGPPLVLTGGRGAGKSALLANWIKRFRQGHEQDAVIFHFASASGRCAEPFLLVRRLLLQLQRRFAIPLEIPELPAQAANSLPLWLHAAARKSRLVLVLGGLDRVRDEHPFRDLCWLPVEFPASVRVILSALPGAKLELLKARGYPIWELPPLDASRALDLAAVFLDHYRKSLTAEQRELISASPEAGNPLYLRLLLEELRVFGVHEQVTARLRELLQARGLPELFRLILRRLEHDHDRLRPGVVREALSLLWASRAGLLEGELVEMLGLLRIDWSRLYAALGELIEDRSGRLVFTHEIVGEAVKQEFLGDQEIQRAVHCRLADYLESHAPLERIADEFCRQLAGAGEWQRLQAALLDLPLLQRMWMVDFQEVIRLWNELEQNGPFRVERSYFAPLEQAVREYLSHAGDQDAKFWHRRFAALQETVYDLLLHMGHLDEAAQVAEMAAGEPGKASARQLTLLGISFLERNQPDKALPHLRAVIEQRGDELRQKDHLIADAWCNLAAAHRQLGNFAEAARLYSQALEVFNPIWGDENPHSAEALQGLGVVHYFRKEYAEAAGHFERALDIQLRLHGPQHPDVAISYNDLANSRGFMGNYPLSAELHEKALAVRRAVLGERHPQAADSLFNLGNIRDLQELPAQALELHLQALAIRVERLGETHDDVGRSRRIIVDIALRWLQHLEAQGASQNGGESEIGHFHRIGTALMDNSQFEPAERSLGHALALSRRVLGQDNPGSADILRDLGSLHERARRHEQALGFYQRALELKIRDLGPGHADVADVRESAAVMLRILGRLDEAEGFFRSVLNARRQWFGQDHPSVAQSHNNLGGLCFRTGRYGEAGEHFQQALAVWRRLGEGVRPLAATTLVNLGRTLLKLGERSAARDCLREAWSLRLRLLGEEHPDTQAAARFLHEAEQGA